MEVTSLRKQTDRQTGKGRQGMPGGGWERNWRFYFQNTRQVCLKVLRELLGKYSLLTSGILAPESGAEGALRKENMGLEMFCKAT